MNLISQRLAPQNRPPGPTSAVAWSFFDFGVRFGFFFGFVLALGGQFGTFFEPGGRLKSFLALFIDLGVRFGSFGSFRRAFWDPCWSLEGILDPFWVILESFLEPFWSPGALKNSFQRGCQKRCGTDQIWVLGRCGLGALKTTIHD